MTSCRDLRDVNVSLVEVSMPWYKVVLQGLASTKADYFMAIPAGAMVHPKSADEFLESVADSLKTGLAIHGRAGRGRAAAFAVTRSMVAKMIVETTRTKLACTRSMFGFLDAFDAVEASRPICTVRAVPGAGRNEAC